MRATSPRGIATIDRDGNFRMDDMPAGKYVLSVGFDHNAPGFIAGYRFTVEPLEGDRAEAELDLAELTLTEPGE